ncbi:MAG TPA: iron-sulfur cluster assembly protein [bacterium]|nr:iron-sulfur cluster assembly protein [bacterium]
MSENGDATTGLEYHGPSQLREAVVHALKTVYDPEIPVDILELGLIYKVKIDDGGQAHVEMTLTSPACPSAEQIPVEVREKIAGIHGVEHAQVDIVWEPSWTPEFMSEAAKLELGMY